MKDNTIVLSVAIASATILSGLALVVGQTTIALVGMGAIAGMLGGHLNGANGAN